MWSSTGCPWKPSSGCTQAILPSAGGLLECLVIFNMPWTLAKGLLDAALCMLIYKPLSPHPARPAVTGTP